MKQEQEALAKMTEHAMTTLGRTSGRQPPAMAGRGSVA